MTQHRQLIDISVDPHDSPDIKRLLSAAKTCWENACKLRATSAAKNGHKLRLAIAQKRDTPAHK
jgi:arsenate reductase-like glutaredoxin family protein